MLSVDAQIASGKLVCPRTHAPLQREGNWLATADGRFRYPLFNGVPVMMPETEQAAYLAQEKGKMAVEYEQAGRQSLWQRFAAWQIARDYRSSPSRRAFAETVSDQPDEALCVSVGGGPFYAHPKLVNLNIGLFANVHIVGDGYALPYAAESVDAFQIEAVLEHLERPETAVAEMFRAARPGAQVLAVTPFMQHYHAYPNHFQNYTLVGQGRLLSRAGFDIISAGVCVGPTYAITSLNYRFVYEYVRLPLLRQLLLALLAGGAVLLRPLDKRLNQRDNAHILASTTYVHAVKPGG
jgi:uncharacterized protein YbaR (Trm112 family)